MTLYRQGMEELMTGTAASLRGEEVTHKVFAHPLPFNVIPHIDVFQVGTLIVQSDHNSCDICCYMSLTACWYLQSNGYTKEEMKVVWETRKIFGLPELQSTCTNSDENCSGDRDIKISCTAVRVPTLRAHCESITIETELPITADMAR